MKDKKIKEPTYEDLSKIYTDEEIADSFVLRSTLTDEEKEIAHADFLKKRLELIKNMSESDIIFSNLMRMKIQIDDYIEGNSYDERFSFSNQLSEYLSITKRSQKDFAAEIDINSATLNRIIKGKENPNIDLLFRIENHSDGLLSAPKLYRLHAMKLETEMINDEENRQSQYKRVKNKLSFAKAG
jgi:transcriptional regulator with XRE-family HTH domain